MICNCGLFASHGRTQYSHSARSFSLSSSSSKAKASAFSLTDVFTISSSFISQEKNYCNTFAAWWLHTNVFMRMQRNKLHCMRTKKLHRRKTTFIIGPANIPTKAPINPPDWISIYNCALLNFITVDLVLTKTFLVLGYFFVLLLVMIHEVILWAKSFS